MNGNNGWAERDADSRGYEYYTGNIPWSGSKPSISWGSIQNSVGFDVSVGMLKGTGFPSYRYHAGLSYYFSDYGGYNGWGHRTGGEWEMFFHSYSGTKFTAGDFSQTTNMVTIGAPFANMSYENDWLFGLEAPGVPQSDGGDRWRSAAAQINFGLISLNLNMFTGDPGLNQDDRSYELIRGHNTYVGGTSRYPNLRAGVFSVGFGPFRIGRNSEDIRCVFQNQFAHDFITGGDAKWFEVLPIPATWIWSFGTDTGGTLW